MATGTPRVHLSIIVPAFNEQERLARTLPLLGAWLAEQRFDSEVLVIDDGSTDDTRRVAATWLERRGGRSGRVVHLLENQGKGHAVRRGVHEAAGRWALVTDADLSTPLEEHSRLAEVARERDLDLVIGSRALPDSRVEVHQGFVRETMGKTFNLLVRALTGIPFRDTQCGFKLMEVQRLRPLFERMVIDRFAYDVELLYLCHRFGLAVGEVPVIWRNDPSSRVRLLTDPPRMLADILRVRWRFRRGLYNPVAT